MFCTFGYINHTECTSLLDVADKLGFKNVRDRFSADELAILAKIEGIEIVQNRLMGL